MLKNGQYHHVYHLEMGHGFHGYVKYPEAKNPSVDSPGPRKPGDEHRQRHEGCSPWMSRKKHGATGQFTKNGDFMVT
jgi:hypothetical protein